MKKSKLFFNRIMILVVALTMLCGLLSACGKKGEKSTGAIYNVENYNFSDSSNMYGYKFIHTGDKIVLYGSSRDPMTDKNFSHVFFFGKDGSVELSYDINLHEDDLQDASLSENGDFYFLRQAEDREGNEPEVLESSVFLKTAGEEAAEGDAVMEVGTEEMPMEGVEDAVAEETPIEDVEEAVAEEMPAEGVEDVAGEEMPAEDTEDEVAEEIPTEDEYIDDVDPEYSDEEGEEESYDYCHQISKVSADGQTIITKKLKDDKAVEELLSIGEDYVHNIVYDQNAVYVFVGDNIVKYDENLNYVSFVPGKKVADAIKDGNLIRGSDGKIYSWYCDGQRDVNIAIADLENGKALESMKAMGERYYINMVSGTSMDFMVRKGSILYGFNFGDNEYTKQVDFLDSDIMTDNVTSVAGLDDNSFMAIYRNMEDDSMCIGYFKKTEGRANANRTDLTLAMIESDSDVKKAVASFNKKNTEYRIRLLDYNAMYGSDDYMVSDTVIEKINTDIIAGNMPDMLLVTKELPVNTYINKDLFEDLYPFIDNDPEMKREDFDLHLLEVFENDGKLFRLVPSYMIRTVYVKEHFVPNKTSWTVKEAQDIFKKSGALVFFSYMDRAYALESCMNMSGSQFVDIENGTCNFNSEDFLDMLEFIKSFPTEYDFNDALNSKINDSFDVMYRKDLVLCQNTTIADMNSYLRTTKGDFGQKVTNIGFPTNNGQGSSIDPQRTLAMSALSDHKDGCWQFMRYFISKEYQDNLDWGFPIRKSSMDEIYRKAKEELFYSYEWNGVVYKEPVTAYVGGVEVTIDPLTDEEEQYFRGFVNSINASVGIDKKIMDILKEECNDYFEGRSTAEEVANRLQSRIQIYIYESQ